MSVSAAPNTIYTSQYSFDGTIQFCNTDKGFMVLDADTGTPIRVCSSIQNGRAACSDEEGIYYISYPLKNGNACIKCSMLHKDEDTTIQIPDRFVECAPIIRNKQQIIVGTRHNIYTINPQSSAMNSILCLHDEVIFAFDFFEDEICVISKKDPDSGVLYLAEIENDRLVNVRKLLLPLAFDAGTSRAQYYETFIASVMFIDPGKVLLCISNQRTLLNFINFSDCSLIASKELDLSLVYNLVFDSVTRELILWGSHLDRQALSMERWISFIDCDHLTSQSIRWPSSYIWSISKAKRSGEIMVLDGEGQHVIQEPGLGPNE